MKTNVAIRSFCALILGLNFSCSSSVNNTADVDLPCKCDTAKVATIVRGRDYLFLTKYDQVSFAPDSIYTLPASENRLLWFRDIESLNATKFTPYWNDNENSNNYYANNLDFINFYKNKRAVEMAFQVGPGGMMWSYHSFVIKKIKGCYLITRTSFTHARFRYKGYAFMSNKKLDEFRKLLKPFVKTRVPVKEKYGLQGHFTDNRNKNLFFINLEKQVDSLNRPNKKIMNFYDFVYDSIPWKQTY
jgi:hypothetical protein